jgi:hypothetical protein
MTFICLTIRVSALRIRNPVLTSNIESMQNTGFKNVFKIKTFHETDDSLRQRDRCWQIHLPAKLELPAVTACSTLSARVTIMCRRIIRNFL